MPTSTEGLPEDSVMRVDKVLTVKGARIVRRPVGKLTPAKICELHGAIGCALDIQY
jgi:mRNA-degrading endonuclease toxin of MazEF toxin-antitoxin module